MFAALINKFLISSLYMSYVLSCSNILVTPGASADNSAIISYNADSGSLYGSLYHYTAGKHAPGSMRQVYDWDSGVYLGEIEEAEYTYNVVGNINEFGLIIGETTFGGISSLQSQTGAKVDYGSLIYITLQRSKTAVEAIKTIDTLMNKYGYYSEGESFSIADKNEVWIMEIIGKGNYELGAVWVARKVPNGYITGHANQARITTFPLNDKENCLYSSDVISFARKIGLYTNEEKDENFSFSDIYDPVTFSGARACEARVWSFFSTIMGTEFANQYQDYAEGYNLTNRMPLWVKPPQEHSISISNVSEYMRNHFENTVLDMTGTNKVDAGAMDSNVPYRWRPLSWEYNDLTYVNERAIGTQQTGWNFIAQSRSNVPTHMSGLLWFGVDDSATTVRFPIYGSATRVPKAFAGKGPQDGVTTPILQFSMNNAFSVFNLVANWAYSRWNIIYPDVYNKIKEYEIKYENEIKTNEITAIQLINTKNINDSIEYLTEYSESTGNTLVNEWSSFFGQIFMKYRDGYVITPSNDPGCGCNVGNVAYSNQWYGRIIGDTGNRYLDPTCVDNKKKLTNTNNMNKKPTELQPINKLTLKSLQ